MKSRKIFPRLAPLVAASLLLNFAHAAQRRQSPTQTTPRPAATPQTQTQTQTPTTTTTTPRAAAPGPQQQQRRAEPDRAVEELLSADAYAVYVELRNVGALAQTQEVKTALGMPALLGDEVKTEVEPLTDLLGFVTENAEQLQSARVVVAYLPTRAELPQVLVALELPSPESAAAFEPKFRRFVGDKVQTLADEVLSTRPEPTRARGAQRPAADKPEPGAKARAAQGASSFTFRRIGRLLLTANEPFTLRKLRGDVGASTLAESVRFQSARTRLASATLFVYVETTLAQQGWALEQQKAQETREAQTTNTRANDSAVIVGTVENGSSSTPAPVAGRSPSTTTAPTSNATLSATVTPTTTSTLTIPTTPTGMNANGAQTTTQTTQAPQTAATPQPQANTVAQPSPTPTPEEASPTEPGQIEGVPVVVVDESNAVGVVRAEAATVTKPSEEQLTVWRMGGVLGNIWRGVPRVPGAVALGVNLDAGNLGVRLAVENTPDGTVSLIPFLPNVVAGPPVTADAAQVAPEDSDIFITTSLDWTQIYNNTLGTAALNPSYTQPWMDEGENEDAVSVAAANASEKPPTADQTVAAIEKIFGFKFKEDLLPSLGNEVAVSLPFNYIYGPRLIFSGQAEKKEEKDSEPGLAIIVSLNNPEKVREIMPRLLAAFSFVSLGTPFAPPEKREGYEIRSAGSVAYAIINNFLVMSDNVKSVRHVVDSYASRHTLATSNAYRDSTQWQAPQKLMQVFVSDALMKSTIEDVKKRSGGSTDPVVRTLLAQLDMTPEPASYEATNEGDAILHELRLPSNLIKAYAVAALVSVKDASVISNEAMAVYALNRINYAERLFKESKKKDRYGTLEELVAEKLLEKEFFEQIQYKLELNASTDKFEATATPRTYGKTGRRSFFINESGTVRAADHKGQPATADDPTVD